MPARSAALASAVQQHKPNSPSDGYPPWLREQVGKYVDERRRGGSRLAHVSVELDLSPTTLGRWQRHYRSQRQDAGFAEVVAVPASSTTSPLARTTPVTPPRAKTPPPTINSDGVHIASPQGFTLHGLSTEQAIAVFMRLP